nr:hypothetical protein [Tanacetum cinerariifolium]
MINGKIVYLTKKENQEYWDKKEEIKKVDEEARLNAISKPEVVKVVCEKAKKLGIHPKEVITTKADELFKKAQEAEHEGLKRQHIEKLREIIPKKKNTMVKDLMNSLCQMYERWSDIDKVRMEALLSYLVAASMVKSPKNARFNMKLRKLIAEHHDQEKLKSKKVKLEALGYNMNRVLMHFLLSFVIDNREHCNQFTCDAILEGDSSSIIHPNPDELVRVEFMINGKIVYLTKKENQEYWDKKEEIKKVDEEARLNAISKPEVVKVVCEKAKKLGIHPKEVITTKADELFKKAQEAEHEGLKRQHIEKLREIIPKKKNTMVKDLMNSLCQMYERWSDIDKVRMEALLSYLVAASMVKSPKNARFNMKLRKLIAEHHDQEKLKSKKVKLEALGYNMNRVLMHFLLSFVIDN